MDYFPEVYHDYYANIKRVDKPEFPSEKLRSMLHWESDCHLYLNNSVEDLNAVELIGVWDTVGFHGQMFGEKIEFRSQKISQNIKYGYHALALDERRYAFRPTLWKNLPANNESQERLQVWFSGKHSDRRRTRRSKTC